MTLALRARAPIATLLLLFAVGIAWKARSQPSKPESTTLVCIDEAAAPAVAAAPPQVDSNVYALLARCLHDGRHPWGDMHMPTVDQVRYWVELEHDPTWLDNGAWWLPLSGEGEERFPSGIYISVPLDGSACGGALVN